jgi:hypothetical protein
MGRKTNQQNQFFCPHNIWQQDEVQATGKRQAPNNK